MNVKAWTVFALALLIAGCPEQKSERVLLVEATTLAREGNIEEAAARFESVFERNPGSADVLLRYGEFLVARGQLDRAATFIESLDAQELRGTDLGRLQSFKRQYFQRIYDQARGDAPAAPADPEAYELGMLGLINLERAGPLLDEYNAYLIMQARSLLGRSPDTPIGDGLDAAVAAASRSQAESALTFLRRLLDGDERSDVDRPVTGLLRDEATALRDALQVALFADSFDTRWNGRYRDAFLRDGRFSAEQNAFLAAYEGPGDEEITAETSPERLRHLARTRFAREIATDWAYELRGVPRDGAAPLPYDVADFAVAQVADVSYGEGVFRFRLTLPYDTVREGAWLLDQRIRAGAAEAELAAEGSGEAEE